jgi:O-antigen/teichoic acid export membrane protein
MTSAPVPPQLSRPQPPPGQAGQFRRGVASVGGGSLVSVAALFIEAVIVARALPISDMGVYVFFQATLALLIIAVDLGFRTTAAQFLAAETDPERRASLVSSMLLLRLLVVALVSVVVVVLSPSLARAFDMPDLTALMVYLPIVLALSSLDELLSGMLQGFQRYRPIALAQMLRSAVRLGLSALVLVVLGGGLPALVASWMVSYGASALLQYACLPGPRRFGLDWPLIKRAVQFGTPLQATRYLWFAMQRINTFVLSALTGPTGVAFYDVAGRVPQGLIRLTEAYYAVYHPSLSTRFARHERVAASRMIEQSLRVFGFGLLMLTWGSILFGRELIVLLFKARYADAAPAFAIMLLGLSLATSINLMGYALTASGHPGKSFLVNLLRSTASVAGAFLLVPLTGFIGAAYATLAAQVVTVPLAWWYMRRQRLPAHGNVHLRQYIAAALLLAAFIWLPPLGFGLRLGLLAAFPIVALGLGLIQLGDFSLLIPERFLPWARLTAQPAGPTGGADR